MEGKVSKNILRKYKTNATRHENKEELSRSGIYCILNLANEHRYIGQSKNIFHRWKQHRNDLRRGDHSNDYLQHAWNLYKPDCFEFLVLEFCEEIELNDKEQYWIERFDPEYNVIKNVFMPGMWYYAGKRIDRGDYRKDGESFIRPIWHLWVYGGHKH